MPTNLSKVYVGTVKFTHCTERGVQCPDDMTIVVIVLAGGGVFRGGLMGHASDIKVGHTIMIWTALKTLIRPDSITTQSRVNCARSDPSIYYVIDCYKLNPVEEVVALVE